MEFFEGTPIPISSLWKRWRLSLEEVCKYIKKAMAIKKYHAPFCIDRKRKFQDTGKIIYEITRLCIRDDVWGEPNFYYGPDVIDCIPVEHCFVSLHTVQYIEILQPALTAIPLDESTTIYAADNSDTKTALAAANKRIEQLEAELQDRQNELLTCTEVTIPELEAKTATLQTELEEAKNKASNDDRSDWPAFWRLVIDLRNDGETDSDIAKTLFKGGEGLSYAQIGALLYDGNDIETIKKDSLQKHGQRLLSGK